MKENNNAINTSAIATSNKIITAIFESNDGWSVNKYWRGAFDSVETAEALSNYGYEFTDGVDTHTCQDFFVFAVPTEVAEAAKKWVKGVQDEMEAEGLTVTHVTIKSIGLLSTKPESKIRSGVELTLTIGHWNGVGDMGLWDDARIKMAFMQRHSFGQLVVEKVTAYAVYDD